MSKHTDLQQLIPEIHRDLVEAVPRGFLESAVSSALLFGALLGSLWTYIVPQWMAGVILVVLVIGQRIYKHRSDILFDGRMASLQTRGFDWKTDEDS